MLTQFCAGRSRISFQYVYVHHAYIVAAGPGYTSVHPSTSGPPAPVKTLTLTITKLLPIPEETSPKNIGERPTILIIVVQVLKKNTYTGTYT